LDVFQSHKPFYIISEDKKNKQRWIKPMKDKENEKCTLADDGISGQAV
jgi:hypothetical protein